MKRMTDDRLTGLIETLNGTQPVGSGGFRWGALREHYGMHEALDLALDLKEARARIAELEAQAAQVASSDLEHQQLQDKLTKLQNSEARK